MEVNTMQHNLQSAGAMHKRELQMVREESSRKEEEHYSQISRLREEIKTTQNSHQDYLSKLMGVLDTTQESRNATSAPSTDIILRKKDEEITDLKDEVARLHRSRNGDIDPSKKEAIKSMKYIIKKNREQRKSRVQHMNELTNRLEESLALGDTHQMQPLLVSMKNAIQTGEKSNSRMDREMVNMIDNTATYAPSDSATIADAHLVAENQKLRHKLEKSKCKKCGYRRGKKGDKSVGDSASVIEGLSKV